MSVDIRKTFSEAFDMTFSRSGAAIIGIYMIFQVVNLVVSQSLFSSFTSTAGANYPLALGLGSTVSGLLWLALLVAGGVIGLGAVRVFVNERTERFPTEYFTEDLLMPLISLWIGGIVFAVLVGIGFILLVIPGIFLMVSLIFWMIYVATEGENFIDAFSSSWSLAKGNRLPLFAIGFLIIIGTWIFTMLFSIPASVLFGSAGSSLATMIPSAIIGVFNIAALASAYNQLTA